MLKINRTSLYKRADSAHTLSPLTCPDPVQKVMFCVQRRPLRRCSPLTPPPAPVRNTNLGPVRDAARPHSGPRAGRQTRTGVTKTARARRARCPPPRLETKDPLDFEATRADFMVIKLAPLLKPPHSATNTRPPQGIFSPPKKLHKPRKHKAGTPM